MVLNPIFRKQRRVYSILSFLTLHWHSLELWMHRKNTRQKTGPLSKNVVQWMIFFIQSGKKREKQRGGSYAEGVVSHCLFHSFLTFRVRLCLSSLHTNDIYTNSAFVIALEKLVYLSGVTYRDKLYAERRKKYPLVGRSGGRGR